MPVALLTDFGTSDYFVGAMKGVILSIAPQVPIVDITHDIEPQNICGGSFVLSSCYRDFPAGTIFLAVVDPGVGSSRRAVAIESQGFYFVGPDNGIFGFLFGEPGWKAFLLEDAQYRRPDVSSTFHGRDIFAPAAAHIAMGVEPGKFGAQITDPVVLAPQQPQQISPRVLKASVVHTDRFGNLITNIASAGLPEKFSLEIAGRTIERKYQCFADATDGEVFLIEGSSGHIEIAVRDGSAAQVLGVKTGAEAILQLSR